MENSSHKRKIVVEDHQADHEYHSLIKKPKPSLSLHSSSSTSDIRLDSLLDTPLPLDWQQCLDIQSGKVHFYNTRTQTRTSIDPREGSSCMSSSAHMRLDLELNLLPRDDEDSNTKLNTTDQWSSEISDHNNLFGINKKKQTLNVPKKISSSSVPSWLTFERDEKSEMFATVCKRCFMLVMLCKASPACPNCKFMHSSSDQSSPDPHLFKTTLSQLLY